MRNGRRLDRILLCICVLVPSFLYALEWWTVFRCFFKGLEVNPRHWPCLDNVITLFYVLNNCEGEKRLLIIIFRVFSHTLNDLVISVG